MLTTQDFSASSCEAASQPTIQAFEHFEAIISTRIIAHKAADLGRQRLPNNLPPEKRKIIHLLESVLTNLL